MPIFIFKMAYLVPPVLSSSLDVDRVVYFQTFGIASKLHLMLGYIISVASVFKFIKQRKLIFLVYMLIPIIYFILEGYRARPVDSVLLISIVSILLAKNKYGKYEFRMKYLFGLFFILIFAASFLAYNTSIRYGIDISEAIQEVGRRAFLANYLVNVERIYYYVNTNGLEYGFSFIRDFISLFSSTNSTQEHITAFSNPYGNEVFIMTMPACAEAILNFKIEFVFLYGLLMSSILIIINKFLSFISNSFYDNHLISASKLVGLYFFLRLTASGGIFNALANRVLPLFIVVIVLVFIFKIINKKKKI